MLNFKSNPVKKIVALFLILLLFQVGFIKAYSECLPEETYDLSWFLGEDGYLYSYDANKDKWENHGNDFDYDSDIVEYDEGFYEDDDGNLYFYDAITDEWLLASEADAGEDICDGDVVQDITVQDNAAQDGVKQDSVTQDDSDIKFDFAERTKHSKAKQNLNKHIKKQIGSQQPRVVYVPYFIPVPVYVPTVPPNNRIPVQVAPNNLRPVAQQQQLRRPAQITVPRVPTQIQRVPTNVIMVTPQVIMTTPQVIMTTPQVIMTTPQMIMG